MNQSLSKTAAIVGAGLVGAGWAIVFARAGWRVRIFDGEPKVRAGVLKLIEGNVRDLAKFELISETPEAVLARLSIHERLADALEGAEYVQESVFETVPVKAAVYAELDRLAPAGIPIGSSSSGIPASAFTENCATRERMLIAHPVNPPYLVPLVELVPTPWTSPVVVDRVHAIMTEVNQEPIRISREVEGFILNRLQGALLNEAWALYDEGYASAADIDKTVSVGLGLRWSFMGPFETIDLNAPGGVADYARRLGALYHGVAKSRTSPREWNESLIARVEKERRQDLAAGNLDARRAWRDRRLMALAAHNAKAVRDVGK